MSQRFRLLSESDVRRTIATVDLVQLMEEALREFSSRRVVQPVRTAVFVGPERSVLGLMPAHLPSRSALGSKLVTVFNSNRELGLPSHYAVVLLFDDRTGALSAVMDGSSITELRTSAVSAIAIRHLAGRPVRRLAIFGCGVQARSHLRTIGAMLPALEEVKVWSPYDDRSAFVNEMQPSVRASIAAAASADAAARLADVVLLVTSSAVPVVERAWIDPGTLVVSVGACRRDHREMDPALVAASRLFVDSRDAALVESGDIVQSISEGRFTPDHIRGELGEVILGRMAPRESPRDIVVFKSLGLAVQDIAVADVVFRRAVQDKLGVELTL